jgi:hypothetical protein
MLPLMNAKDNMTIIFVSKCTRRSNTSYCFTIPPTFVKAGTIKEGKEYKLHIPITLNNHA